MLARKTVFAGQFYPATANQCVAAVDQLLMRDPGATGPGAVVPHAGWVYSGATAGLGIRAIAALSPQVVVIFGAMHTLDINAASLYASGYWETPLGALRVDESLAATFLRCPLIADNPGGHAEEHSIEVQLPLLKRALPQVRIVPLTVRPSPEALTIGKHCGLEAAKYGRTVAFLASTDLTHYGPAFRFEPHGSGPAGTGWALVENDRRFITLIRQLAAEEVIAEAARHRNACGAGAVAALLAAMREIGAEEYVELEHTSSARVRGDAEAVNAVGYHAGVFRRRGAAHT